MRKYGFFFLGLLSCSILLLPGCKNRSGKDGADKQDILTGKLPVLVDETLYPILQECADVFESSYPNSSLEILSRPEIRAINALLGDSASVIILTRKLTDTENRYFKDRGIEPKIYQIGSDAVVFINNVSSPDTIMSRSTVKSLLNGEVAGKKLVFDNANSSTLRYLKDFFKIQKLDVNSVAALSTNEKVIEYVGNTPGAIGVIGLNWWLKAAEKNTKVLDKIRTLSIESRSEAGKTAGYYKQMIRRNAAAQNFITAFVRVPQRVRIRIIKRQKKKRRRRKDGRSTFISSLHHCLNFLVRASSAPRNARVKDQIQ